MPVTLDECRAGRCSRQHKCGWRLHSAAAPTQPTRSAVSVAVLQIDPEKRVWSQVPHYAPLTGCWLSEPMLLLYGIGLWQIFEAGANQAMIAASNFAAVRKSLLSTYLTGLSLSWAAVAANSFCSCRTSPHHTGGNTKDGSPQSDQMAISVHTNRRIGYTLRLFSQFLS